MVGLLRTMLANGLDHSTSSFPHSGPVVSEILHKASPTLLSVRLALKAVVP